MNVWPILAGVLGANLLTIVFVAGLWQARNRTTRQTSTQALLCLVVPLLVLAFAIFAANHQPEDGWSVVQVD